MEYSEAIEWCEENSATVEFFSPDDVEIHAYVTGHKDEQIYWGTSFLAAVQSAIQETGDES